MEKWGVVVWVVKMRHSESFLYHNELKWLVIVIRPERGG